MGIHAIRQSRVSAYQVGLLAAGILLGSLGAVCLKIGAAQLFWTGDLVADAVRACVNPFVLGGLILYFFPAVIWLVLLNSLPLSFLQPLLSLTYVCTPLLAVLLLGEQVTVQRWTGIFVVLLGVVIIARS